MTLFRVDFGSKTGLGHLKRSVVYAKEFKDVVYISKSSQKELLEYPLVTIKDEDDFFLHVKKMQPQEVVIDNYNFSYEDEKRFKKLFADIKLSVFDDDYRKHYCDVIINHNLGVNPDRYENPEKVKIIPPLIADKFKEAKREKYINRDGLFISFGGSDALGLTLRVLKLLKNCKINIYTTSSNKNLKMIKRYCYLHKNISLHVDENIAEAMRRNSCGIITPSTIAYEAIYMDMDFIAISVAKNQDNLVKYLKQKRYTVLKTRELYKLKRRVKICKIC